MERKTPQLQSRYYFTRKEISPFCPCVLNLSSVSSEAMLLSTQHLLSITFCSGSFLAEVSPLFIRQSLSQLSHFIGKLSEIPQVSFLTIFMLMTQNLQLWLRFLQMLQIHKTFSTPDNCSSKCLKQIFIFIAIHLSN